MLYQLLLSMNLWPRRREAAHQRCTSCTVQRAGWHVFPSPGSTHFIIVEMVLGVLTPPVVVQPPYLRRSREQQG